MSSIVQIKDSAYDGLQSLRVYGNTVQNLWVNPSGTQNGITVTSNADGSVTVSGTTVYPNTEVSSDSFILVPGKQYTLSIDKNVEQTLSGANFLITFINASGSQISFEAARISGTTFTVPENTVKSKFKFYAGQTVSSDNTQTVSGTYRVMLNEGSTAEPWCPPGLNSVGDGGSVDIVTAGKNLLKPEGSKVLQGVTYTVNQDGSVTCSGTNKGSNAIGFYYPSSTWDNALLIPAGTYTLSVSGVSGKGTAFISKKASRDSEADILYQSGTDGGHTFTTEAPVLIIAQFNTAGKASVDTTIRFQLECGSTATDFEPYKGGTTTSIDLQGHTLNALPDGTRDELHIDGGGNVVLEKRTWSDVFDGTENWQDSTNRYGLATGATFATTTDTVIRDKQLADTLPVLDAVGGATGIRTYSSRWVDASITSMLGDLAGFKAWLGNNNTTLIYKLAEPRTIDLGTVDLPKLRKNKVNTIWVNGSADTTGFSPAPDIEVDYYRWKPCSDGFKADGKHTSRDFGMCIASRDTGTPVKKAITATVPYMSGFYDFSALYGSPAYESREVTYTFEFLEDSTEALQEKKSAVLDWLTKIQDVPIYDDDLEWKHFVGSYSGSEFEENEDGISGTLEVTFLCQPFIEADRDTTVTLNAGANTVSVKGQPVNAYAKTSSGTATIQIGGVTQSVGTTEIRLSVQLQPGDNAVTVTGSPVVLRWKELTA